MFTVESIIIAVQQHEGLSYSLHTGYRFDQISLLLAFQTPVKLWLASIPVRAAVKPHRLSTLEPLPGRNLHGLVKLLLLV